MNRLAYGFETTQMHSRLFMDVPAELAVSLQQGVVSDIERLSQSRTRYLDVLPQEGSSRLYINAKKLGGIRDDSKRYATAAKVVDIISGIDLRADQTEKDPGLTVQMSGVLDQSSGRRGMVARVTWPNDVPDANLSRTITHYMQDTAHKLNYERKMIGELVYGQVARERGVVLETNPIGSCNISAGGDWYDPAEPTVELWQHNIYNPMQQLICFAGAVAFARAAELELPTSN